MNEIVIRFNGVKHGVRMALQWDSKGCNMLKLLCHWMNGFTMKLIGL